MSGHEAFEISKSMLSGTPGARRAPGAPKMVDGGTFKRTMAANLSLADSAPKRRGLSPLGSKAAKVGARASAFGAGRQPGVGHLAPKAGLHKAPVGVAETLERRTGDAGRGMHQQATLDRVLAPLGASATPTGATSGNVVERGAGIAGHLTEHAGAGRSGGHMVEHGLILAHHLLAKNASGHDAFEVRCA